MPPLTLTYCPMSLRSLTLGSWLIGVLAGRNGETLHSSLFTLNFRLTPPIISLNYQYPRASAGNNAYGTFAYIANKTAIMQACRSRVYL